MGDASTGDGTALAQSIVAFMDLIDAFSTACSVDIRDDTSQLAREWSYW